MAWKPTWKCHIIQSENVAAYTMTVCSARQIHVKFYSTNRYMTMVVIGRPGKVRHY